MRHSRCREAGVVASNTYSGDKVLPRCGRCSINGKNRCPLCLCCFYRLPLCAILGYAYTSSASSVLLKTGLYRLFPCPFVRRIRETRCRRKTTALFIGRVRRHANSARLRRMLTRTKERVGNLPRSSASMHI